MQRQIKQPEEPAQEATSLERLEESAQVLRAQQGDAQAFAWLIARHERPLLYYLRRFISEPEAALDVHQEVWLAVFRGLSKLRSAPAFRGWLYRLAHDQAVRYIRDEVREAESKEVMEVGPEELETKAEDAEMIHLGLLSLSPAHREALTLHYLRDLSLEEIATAINVPLGTVKSRLHHARVALREHLERKSDAQPQ
jgi:RNA polymerase sigma factor (sigma-70 family)